MVAPLENLKPIPDDLCKIFTTVPRSHVAIARIAALGEAGVGWSDADRGMRCVVLSEDVQRLRAFALVVDLGSISVAATVLGQTQRAVWQQVEAFERGGGCGARRPLSATPARDGGWEHAAAAGRPRARRALRIGKPSRRARVPLRSVRTDHAEGS
jgi:hypothetical protein